MWLFLEICSLSFTGRMEASRRVGVVVAAEMVLHFAKDLSLEEGEEVDLGAHCCL